MNNQNIDNSECFGVTFVKNLSRNDFIIIFGKNLVWSESKIFFLHDIYKQHSHLSKVFGNVKKIPI
jgi:hypothetical protein